ncbi:hypothetical protein [Streptomyces sp. NPDC047028]|uniref:hypothetical protein n=1 Tax=Streptomyces sp. NPDC047028 TaxID=3155793 RepID=UPI0034049399
MPKVHTRSCNTGKAAIHTAPAGLHDRFGGSKAGGKSAVTAASWRVKPLPDARPSVGSLSLDRRNSGRRLHIGFAADLPMFGGRRGLARETKVEGFLDMAPEVAFSYDGHGSADPAAATAAVRVTGRYKAGWHVKGPVAGPRLRFRVPIAMLAAYPVVIAGTVPVVIALKLRLVLEVRVDGRMTMDVQEAGGGTVRAGTRYTRAAGWQPDNGVDAGPLPGGTAKVSGEGALRLMLGPELSVALYDAVGVDAFAGPYLRITAAGLRPATKDGGQPTGDPRLYGGVTLETSVFAGSPAKVLGIRLRKRVVFPVITREWPISPAR